MSGRGDHEEGSGRSGVSRVKQGGISRREEIKGTKDVKPVGESRYIYCRV